MRPRRRSYANWPPIGSMEGAGMRSPRHSVARAMRGALSEHLRPQLAAQLNDLVRRDGQALGGLANRLGVWRFVQAIGLFLVSTQKREDPLEAQLVVHL